jgi:DNA-binding XRE family transcriptional regulator
MAGNVQFIVTPGGEEMAVIPRADYERMKSALAKAGDDEADAREAAEILARVRAGKEEVFPAAVVRALVEGVDPIKVFREYRGLTQKELAAKAGINPVYLSQIERGKRTGSVETLKAIASVLGVEVDDLIP